MPADPTTAPSNAMSRRRLLMLAPLGVAAAAGVAFWSMLERMEQGTFDPHGVSNPLIGHAVPDFALPGLAPAEGFSGAELREAAATRPVLVNFFASWCVPCVEEVEVLAGLHARGLPIWGVAYKDKPELAAGFVARGGSPYSRIGLDLPGQVAIDWGVTAVPESYVIGRDGIVQWRWVGPFDPQIVSLQLDPVLRRLA